MTRRQAQHAAWIACGLGLVGAILGWSTAAASFPYAWLAALVTWMGWPLGCLMLILVHALTGGRWGYALRPYLVAGASSLWLLILVAVPWVLCTPSLYPWLHPEAAAHLANGFYLNRLFFVWRGIFYLVTWMGLRVMMSRALQADTPDTALAQIAPAGLILLAVTITFSAVDLTMSLDPQFNSSVYGLIEISEMGLFALSVVTFIAAVAAPAPPLEMLGKLLLGLVLLWAYLDFMQLLIVWESDLSAEARWYLIRFSGGWGVTTTLISAGHFILPLCALIWPQVRRSRRGIALVSALLAVSEIARVWWLVVPASGEKFGPADLTAMACVLGAGAAVTLLKLPPDASLLPSVPVAREEAHG